MSRQQQLLSAAVLLALVTPSACLDNGMARKPPMGFNTWNSFGPAIDERLIRDTADLLVSSGLASIGYRFLNLDDGWSSRNRTADGRLIGDLQRFPSGIKSLAEYVHARGLNFGIYGDSGVWTCEGYPGSRGHEAVDAQTWAEWGIDYLKYDNCFGIEGDSIQGRYRAMRDALNSTSRRIVYSLCNWGQADPWLWGAKMGNLWRTTADITPSWLSICLSVDNSVGLARFAGPGGWNDGDMLEVGVGQLSPAEQRSHFALWALLKFPLIIGADLRSISPESLGILKAGEVIAINQDDLGVPGDLIWKQGAREIYAAPLSCGARAVVLLNRHNDPPAARIAVHWVALGYPADVRATVRDLYARKDLGVFRGSYTAEVELHDVAALRITPLQAVPGADKWRPWHGQPMYAPEGPDPGQGGDGGREWEQTMHASRGKAPAVQGPKCASDAWAAPLAAAEGALETGDGAEQRFTVS